MCPPPEAASAGGKVAPFPLCATARGQDARVAASLSRFARGRQLTQHVVQDAAMLEVLALLRRVDADANFELDRRAGRRRGDHSHHLRRATVQADDLEALLAGEAEAG